MAATIEIGEIFDGRYELLDVLGSGGQSTVYKARQLIGINTKQPSALLSNPTREQISYE